MVWYGMVWYVRLGYGIWYMVWLCIVWHHGIVKFSSSSSSSSSFSVFFFFLLLLSSFPFLFCSLLVCPQRLSWWGGGCGDNMYIDMSFLSFFFSLMGWVPMELLLPMTWRKTYKLAPTFLLFLLFVFCLFFNAPLSLTHTNTVNVGKTKHMRVKTRQPNTCLPHLYIARAKILNL